MNLSVIAEKLDLVQPGRRVLIVEDHVPTLRAIRGFCVSKGHSVTAMVGVDRIEGDLAVGTGDDLVERMAVDLSEIDAAFLDHFFLSRKYNGASLTRELMLRGSPKILGMSSDNTANDSMRREGAIAAIRKADLMRLILTA